MITQDGLFIRRSNQLAALALRYALPAIFQFREFAEAGGLMSYGNSLAEQYRQSCVKQKACRLARGETLGTPEVYELARGQRDLKLTRREDLEREMTGDGGR